MNSVAVSTNMCFGPVIWGILAGLAALAVLVLVVIKIVIFCKIFAKAGYCWALGLLMLVPIVNVVMLFVLAFAQWPVERELQQLRQRAGESS